MKLTQTKNMNSPAVTGRARTVPVTGNHSTGMESGDFKRGYAERGMPAATVNSPDGKFFDQDV